MKKLILITLILLLFISVPVSAETDFGINFAWIEGANIDEDYIPGGKIKLSTNQYNYNDLYDLLEFSSTFGIDDPDYNFVSSDLLFYSNIESLEGAGNYVGIGIKQLFFDNSQASDFIFDSDITAYALPLALKLENNQGQLKTFVEFKIFKGKYSMTVPGEDAESDFDGKSINLGFKFGFEKFDLKLSYQQEDYSFDKDDNLFGATNFEDDYKGILLGISF